MKQRNLFLRIIYRMPRTIKLLYQAGIRIGRCLSEVLPYAIYIREVQLIGFSRDIRKINPQTMIKWGLPARLAVEVKVLADLYYFESSVLKLARTWRRKLKPRLVAMKSQDFEWDVASSDFSEDDFKQPDGEDTHKTANEKIKNALQVHVHKWRLRRSTRVDQNCQVAVKLHHIANVFRVEQAEYVQWYKLLVKRHWIRKIEDVRCIPDDIWQQWSCEGLPWRVATALRSFDPVIISPEIPMLPAVSPWRSPRNKVARQSDASLATRPGISSSTFAEESNNSIVPTTASTSPRIVNSLLTLQSKLLEFTKDRPRQKLVEASPAEDAEIAAAKFTSVMEVNVDGTWSQPFSFRLVQSSRMKWALAWWPVGKEQQGPVGHVAVLSIAKVARSEALVFVIKYRSSSKVEEIYLRCKSEEEQTSTAKLLRRLIRETRMKTVILGN